MKNQKKKKWKVLQWIKQYILFCQNKAACKRVYIFNSLSLFGRASSVGFRTGWVCRSSSALRHSSLLPTYAYFLTNLVCVFNSISIFTIHGIFVVVIVVPLFAFRKHVEDVFEFLSLNFDRTSAASMLLFLSGMYLFVLMSSQTRQATSLPHSSYSLLLPCYLVLLSSPRPPSPHPELDKHPIHWLRLYVARLLIQSWQLFRLTHLSIWFWDFETRMCVVLLSTFRLRDFWKTMSFSIGYQALKWDFQNVKQFLFPKNFHEYNFKWNM